MEPVPLAGLAEDPWLPATPPAAAVALPPRLSLAVAGPSPFEAALDAALDAAEDAADEDAATEPVVVGSPLSPRSGWTFGPQ